MQTNRQFITFITFASIFAFSVGCQQQVEPTVEVPASQTVQVSLENQVVEASCGQCNLGLEGRGCDLAIRVDGEAYYVDGTSISDHGDEHGEDGMCSCVREAKVSGELVDGRFQVTSFELLPKQ